MDSLSSIKTTLRGLAERYDYFVFDCDGVIWHGNKPIGDTFRNLELLAGLGKSIFFVTNLAAVSRKGLAAKMLSTPFNFKVNPKTLYPASTLAGLHVR